MPHHPRILQTIRGTNHTLYPPLIVLDFDNLPNIEAAKQILSSLPYIYYAGLSVSGRGIFAIIPIAATDHTQHKTYPPRTLCTLRTLPPIPSPQSAENAIGVDKSKSL